MGKYFILLIIAILIGMGTLGWFVLQPDRANFPRMSSALAQTFDRVNLDNETQAELLLIINDLESPARLEAVLKLMEVEQEQAVLVPALAGLLQDSDQLVKIAAGIVLKRIGATGAIHLRSMMESDDVYEANFACAAIKEMGGANQYEPLMRKWLSEPDSASRKRALFALQGSTDGVLELLDLITETLTDSDFNVQCMACRVLISLGPDAIDATEKVLELHRTGIPSPRSWAAITLGAIGPNTKLDTAEFLAGTLDAFMQMEKQRSLEGLALMGPEASAVAETIREVMRDQKKRVMHNAAYTLWRITGETDEPFKVLAAALDDPSYTDETIELIGKMEVAGKPFVGQIIRIIESTDEVASIDLAIVAIGNIGNGAQEALPVLKKIAESEKHDALIRFYAREAIEKIDSTQ